MARPAARSPDPRLVMSADSLLRSSLQPIIASRSWRSQRSKDLNESARLSEIQYGRPDNLSTPRNMYDYETGSTIMAAPVVATTTRPSVNNNTQTHSIFNSTTIPYQSRQQRPYLSPSVMILHNQHPSHHHGVVETYGSKVPHGHHNPAVFYNPPDRRHHYPHHRRMRPYRRRRPRRRRRGRGGSLRPPCCYIFLKFVELMTCITILVLTRIWDNHLSLDYVYTTFAAIGILACGLGLIVLWMKGHPIPGQWLHVAMLLVYAITIPVLLCGGMMLLLISSSNLYVYVVSSLFFFSAVLFILDVVIMTSGILQCGCCCYQPYHRHRRTHPNRWHEYDDDYHHRRHHHHHSYPSEDPGYYSYGSDQTYPRSVPQMSMRTRRDDW